MDKYAILAFLKKYPIATIAFSVFFALVVVYFMRGDQSIELESQEVKLNAELNVLDANLKNSVSLEAETEAAEGYVEAIQDKLLNLDQKAINTNFFYSLDRLADIQINSVNTQRDPDPSISPKGPNELKLYEHTVQSISISGAYEEIVQFIGRLPKVDAFVRVTDVELNRGAGAVNDIGYTARVQFVILAQK